MGTHYSPRVSTNGLALHLDAANKKSYPGTGTTISSLITPHTASLVNATYASGYFTFSGNASYLGTSYVPDLSGELTYAIWVRPITTPIGRHQFMASDDGGYDMSILHEGTYWYYFNEAGPVSTGMTITTGVWTYAVLTKTIGAVYSFYLNGAFVGSTAGAHGSSQNALRFAGSPYAGGSEYANCDLAIGTIYTRALAAGDVSQNFQALRGRFGI